jgi:hypothetical protein
MPLICPVFYVLSVHAADRTSANQDPGISRLITGGQYNFPRCMGSDIFFYCLYNLDAVIVRVAATTVFDANLESNQSFSFMPQSFLATFCLLFKLTWREIIILCAWGEPAPCMDSVR